jgi:cysteine-rich repeat protein
MRRATLAFLFGLAVLGAGCGPVCGNGETEDEEQCDDGNNDNGDGCSEVCTVEIPDIGIPDIDIPDFPAAPEEAPESAPTE